MTEQLRPAVRVAVDIGGTFTDLVGQSSDGQLHYLKVPTTPDDPGEAVVSGLIELLASMARSAESEGDAHSGPAAAAGRLAAADSDVSLLQSRLGAVTEIIHGTTVGSNTLLQQTGAKTGVLTTRGFRDILEIGRIRTPTMFDLTWKKPEPLALRRHRIEVLERIGADGAIITPLDEAEVRSAGRRFVQDGVESVAICFINSFTNDAHERRAQAILEAAFPNLFVTASCDVLPEIKEYERTSTTVVNAYLLKAMRGYLDRLTERLASAGLTAPLRVVTSQGGMVNIRTAAERPVMVVGSGPAGGVIGGAGLASALGTADLIVFDLGGTTAKASVVEDGAPALTTEYEFRDGISSPSRFIKGGGYMLKVPAIDIAEVGAGGGSIAWVDGGGLLKVGPQSAGAVPGPACYGRGNEYPTLTDANVVLGHLNPVGLVGGRLGIDPTLAAKAIQTHIAEPLGLSLVGAAAGIRHIANLEMARAIRAVTVERGRDPREMTLLAAGGGGPVHAAELATLLGIGQVVIAPLSGVFCSLGMLSADTTHSLVRTVQLSLEQFRSRGLAAEMEQLQQEATRRMREEGVDLETVAYDFSLDARYVGQSSELAVPFTAGTTSETLYRQFSARYQRTFGHATEEPMEIVNLRLLASSRHPQALKFDHLHWQAPGATEAAVPEFRRDAVFGTSETYLSVPVFSRSAMPDEPVTGPAIIEAYDTTVVLPPGSVGGVHPTGALTISIPIENQVK